VWSVEINSKFSRVVEVEVEVEVTAREQRQQKAKTLKADWQRNLKVEGSIFYLKSMFSSHFHAAARP
jgi:hypothetical protein